MKPRIALSLGDPAGIGPEVAAKALGQPKLATAAEWVLAGSPASLPLAWRKRLAERPGLRWLKVPDPGVWRLGRPSAASGAVAAASVLAASGMALTGQAQALVTAPLSKEALKLAGYRFPGHTEMLAHGAGLLPGQVGMLLCGGGLRVFLLTRHCSLRQAIAQLKPGLVVDAAQMLAQGLRERFGIAKPRLALAALNPHAGEAGAFGDEESRLLAPAVKGLRASRGFSLLGPLPADTVFVQARQGRFDAVLCCYHDQGLIPLKLLAFESGVNTTLGLPYPRTSPDHGTAFDIAGKGKADPGSMVAAMEMAVDLARHSRRTRS